MKFNLLGGLLALLTALPATAAVTVSNPAPGSTVVSPVPFTATATTSCSSGVASMGVYVNNVLISGSVQQGNKLSYNLSLSPGSYTNIVVQEWDHCGGSTKTTLGLNVVKAGTVEYGAVNVTAPPPSSSTLSPFALTATDGICEGQGVSTMAYSIDNDGTLLATANSTSLNTQVTAAVGTHLLHVKAWGPNGAACDTDVAVNVIAPQPKPTDVIPTNAQVTQNIQTALNWKLQYDPGTSGSASGTFSIESTPSLSGASRKFDTTFSNNGGELYYDNFLTPNADTTSQNWFLDEYIYIVGPSTDLANVEADLNQVVPNGDTVIFGVQCDGWNNTWDYTYTDTSSHWTRSSQPCNPRNWSTGTWHHLQYYVSQDGNENVTYHTIWLDGQEFDINATVHSGLALGWAFANIMNFQIDGLGSSGTVTTYLDNVTISRW